LKSDSSGRGYGHTMYDTVDKVEMRSMREAAVLAARLALRMATAENWPVGKRSAQDVKEVLDSPDNREYTEFSAQVNTYYRENQ